MTDYRSLYDKDFIGAWDLQDGDVTVTITKVIGGNLTGIGGRKSKKPVVYMSHTDKGFACNVTNGRTIATMYGVHVEKWAGKKITLYKSTTRNPDGTGDVECIRVRPSVKEGAPNPPAQAAESPAGSSPAAAPAAGGTITTITNEQAFELMRLCQDNGIALELARRAWKVAEIGQLPADSYEEALGWIDRNKGKRKAK